MKKEDLNNNQAPEDAMKREFLEKFGKLAAAAPVGMFLLMGPTQSKANTSGPVDETTSVK